MDNIDAIITPYTSDSRLLPNSIRDERSLALLHLMWGLTRFETSRLLVYNIDTVDASALPHLVQQFRLEKFIPLNIPENRLRLLLKRAIEIWRYLGTRHGMQIVVDAALGVNINFLEWWQYNGTPHTFVVEFSIDESQGTYLNDFGAEFQASLLQVIQAVKPIRSHFIRLDLGTKAQATLETAALVEFGEVCMVFNCSRIEDNFVNPALAFVHHGFTLVMN